MSTESTESVKKPDIEIARQAGYDVGHAEGFALGLKAVLDRLQYLYIDDPGRPDRGTPKGDAILQVGREVMDWTRKVQSGEIKVGEVGA